MPLTEKKARAIERPNIKTTSRDARSRLSAVEEEVGRVVVAHHAAAGAWCLGPEERSDLETHNVECVPTGRRSLECRRTGIASPNRTVLVSREVLWREWMGSG